MVTFIAQLSNSGDIIKYSRDNLTLSVILYDDNTSLIGNFTSTTSVKKEAAKAVINFAMVDYNLIYKIEAKGVSDVCEIYHSKSYNVSLPFRFCVEGVESPDEFCVIEY